MRGFWVLALLLSAFIVLGASKKSQKAKCDLLYLRNGKTLEVVVLDLGNDSLHYRLPKLQKKYAMLRSDVVRIAYKNGTVVHLDATGEVTKTTDESWRNVEITRKKKEVAGMAFVEKIDVTLTTGRKMTKTKPEELEASAMEQLQQEALQKKATTIYIKSTNFKTAYGEPPAIHIVGEYYRSVSKTQR